MVSWLVLVDCLFTVSDLGLPLRRGGLFVTCRLSGSSRTGSPTLTSSPGGHQVGNLGQRRDTAVHPVPISSLFKSFQPFPLIQAQLRAQWGQAGRCSQLQGLFCPSCSPQTTSWLEAGRRATRLSSTRVDPASILTSGAGGGAWRPRYDRQPAGSPVSMRVWVARVFSSGNQPFKSRWLWV